MFPIYHTKEKRAEQYGAQKEISNCKK